MFVGDEEVFQAFSVEPCHVGNLFFLWDDGGGGGVVGGGGSAHGVFFEMPIDDAILVVGC